MVGRGALREYLRGALWVLPAHVLARYPNINQVPFNQLPIGTGPFRVVKWVRGDHVELVANDDYFRGRPKLRRIFVRRGMIMPRPWRCGTNIARLGNRSNNCWRWSREISIIGRWRPLSL